MVGAGVITGTVATGFHPGRVPEPKTSGVEAGLYRGAMRFVEV
ncbi:MAG: hypothetical protein AMXMBFR82_41530 [Candidatus Hydrogenedentota bacterium]